MVPIPFGGLGADGLQELCAPATTPQLSIPPPEKPSEASGAQLQACVCSEPILCKKDLES